MISLNISIETNANALVCGEVTNNDDYLDENKIKYITNEEYTNYLTSRKVTFDANGGVLGTETDYKMVPYNGLIGELPFVSRDYHTFTGWFTEAEGGEEVTAETVMSSLVDITLYAHWEENPLSAWVLKTEMPDDAEIVDTKYTYTQTLYTTSSSSSLSGWTKYDTTYVWGSYGGWSDWVNWDPGSSDSRQKESRWIAPTYKTQWKYSGYYNGTWNTHCATCGGSKNSGASYVETEWLDYQVSTTGVTFYCPNVGTVTEYYAWTPTHGNRKLYTVNTRQVETSAGYTQLRYRDRSKVYTYYFKKDENKESATYPSESNISNIQEYVQYIIK